MLAIAARGRASQVAALGLAHFRRLGSLGGRRTKALYRPQPPAAPQEAPSLSAPVPLTPLAAVALLEARK